MTKLESTTETVQTDAVEMMESAHKEAKVSKVPKKLPPAEERLRKAHKEDSKPVKGIFRCFEPMGGEMTFSFRKYKYDPVMKFTMRDGQTYTVPKMVAKHLNQNCYYERNKFLMDKDGNPYPAVDSRVKRCSFESLEFSE